MLAAAVPESLLSRGIALTQEARAEALSYNGLVQSWPEIVRLAGESAVLD